MFVDDVSQSMPRASMGVGGPGAPIPSTLNFRHDVCTVRVDAHWRHCIREGHAYCPKFSGEYILIFVGERQRAVGLETFPAYPVHGSETPACPTDGFIFSVQEGAVGVNIPRNETIVLTSCVLYFAF